MRELRTPTEALEAVPAVRDTAAAIIAAAAADGYDGADLQTEVAVRLADAVEAMAFGVPGEQGDAFSGYLSAAAEALLAVAFQAVNWHELAARRIIAAAV